MQDNLSIYPVPLVIYLQVTFPGSRDSDLDLLGGHYSTYHKVRPERSEELGGKLAGKAFQTKGTGWAKARRQESRVKPVWQEWSKCGKSGGGEGRGEQGLCRALQAAVRTLAVTSSEVGAPGGLRAEAGWALTQVLIGSLWPPLGRDCCKQTRAGNPLRRQQQW